MHDFHERLEFSQEHKHEDFWQAVYEKAFPDMQFATAVTKKCQGQYLGVDRVVYLGSSKVLMIDEKLREEDYNDIFLEYLSNDQTGADGWMEKDLLIDFLAYAFLPSRRCYLFNWQMLRRAWVCYKSEWMEKYPKKPAQNKGYRTWGVPVPIHTLLKAVKDASIIQID